ncbi:hypothetical protein N7532_011224 [Penicillium argentinense]|uniref:galacturonan 1,4-alpha-galacturonidase n=1 Tax=Penicillium argentinense TaxID=1131581 RepID=A0A9W9EI73_9EURO|nr:uncharacterized protein N7532_011224 [Penicillium argentinense]KAJ5082181.1 hypothetical protein N7532_011224 [Penicillium argentinense]
MCGTNGTVIFSENVFHVNTMLNITNLLNCDVHLRGELRFSTDIPYWRTHAFSVVLQDQVTAWLFGGTNVNFYGEGGFYNGGGQAWYNANRNESNQPGRPMSMTFYNSTNLHVDGLKIIQPQFWALSDSEWYTMNCDGYNSWRSRNLLVENATIITGDDCIAAKGNTSNLHAKNTYCEGGTGITFGSIGQYLDMPDYNTNTTFENVTIKNAVDGAYIKTWQELTFKDFEMINVRLSIQMSQLKTSSGRTFAAPLGSTSFLLYTIPMRVSCPNITFDNVNVTSVNSTLDLPYYDTEVNHEIFQCTNIVGQNNSGIPCNMAAPSNFSQWIYGNVDSSGLATLS